jgi:hypothetical protein
MTYFRTRANPQLCWRQCSKTTAGVIRNGIYTMDSIIPASTKLWALRAVRRAVRGSRAVVEWTLKSGGCHDLAGWHRNLHLAASDSFLLSVIGSCGRSPIADRRFGPR